MGIGVGLSCSVPSPALYAIAVAPYLYGYVAGMEHFLETVVACEKGYHSRPLLQSAALVTVHRDGHVLANRLSTAVSRKVDKCWVKFWVAYGTLMRVMCYDLLLWR
ncbi:unnamed protein product [Penicillium roqueforti FM164]|uniref:Genomic scaffold, ProqFM164S02 n=1 Tax=Penicillium roqueforti (strain FM164) TaxID=1365484 RepID=W6Q9A4_PENRF|nr:unnamed protein product [Penicillium roqueforti FM164]